MYNDSRFLLFTILVLIATMSWTCVQAQYKPRKAVDNYLVAYYQEDNLLKRESLLEQAEAEILNIKNFSSMAYDEFINVVSVVDPEEVFKIAFENWNKDFQKKKYFKIVLALAENDFSVLSKKNIKFINAFRQKTHFLRMVFNIFDMDHSPPKFFKKFTVQSGKLKDLITLSGKSNFQLKRKEIKRKAKLILSIYNESNLSKEVSSLNLSGVGDFRKYFLNLTRNIVNSLEKQSLTIREFHHVRKNIKEIQFALRYMLVNKPKQKELINVFRDLDKIRSEMGHIHNLYIELKINNYIDYKKDTIRILNEYKEIMKSLVMIMDNQLCAVHFSSKRLEL